MDLQISVHAGWFIFELLKMRVPYMQFQFVGPIRSEE